MTENIPCIKNKCILYPVCKSKTYIECKILSNWLNKEPTFSLYILRKRIIAQHLPKLNELRAGNINHNWFTDKDFIYENPVR
jgi:hypothetical protein